MAKNDDVKDPKDLQGDKKDPADTKAEKGKFNSKWLDGLKFHYAEKKMIEKNGRKTLQAIAMERPLKEDDLLAWKDLGDKVVIVTKNGKKYFIKK